MKLTAFSGDGLWVWDSGGAQWVVDGRISAGGYGSPPAVLTYDDGSGAALYFGGTQGSWPGAGAYALTTEGTNYYEWGVCRLKTMPITPAVHAYQSIGYYSGIGNINSFGLSFLNARPGHEYFHVFSFDVGGPQGQGPYFGLYANSIGDLLPQILVPLEAPPFHVVGDWYFYLGAGASLYDFSVYNLPSPPSTPVSFDVLTVDISPVTGICIAPVVRNTILL